MAKITGSTTFKIPEGCCKCLAPAGKNIRLYGGYQYDDNGVRHTRSFELKIPICSSCRKAINQKRLLGAASLPLVAAAGWLIGSQFGDEYHIWGAIAGVIIGFIVAVGVFVGSGPGEVRENGLPEFKNKEFHKRFVELNNIDPRAYEALDNFDPKLFEAAEEELKRRKGSADAYRQAMDSVVDGSNTGDEASVVFAFGDGTSILKFPDGMETQYKMHLRLVEHLKAGGDYPSLSVCGMIAGTNASCSRLILVTGATDEVAKLSQVFYTAAAEAFVDQECGGDWTAVTPASTVSNVAEPGMAVDPGPYNELSQEIRKGAFQFDTTLW